MTDPAAGERSLARAREQVLSGSLATDTVRARPEVAASWRRVSAVGLRPDADPQITPLDAAAIERRRVRSPLAGQVPGIVESLRAVTDAGHLVVIADADGRVLWRAGTSRIKRHADDLGFIGGSEWSEGNVGTNAIGTALVVGEPVLLRGPEHFLESHTAWGCAAAPIVDPTSGETLGVVDVSGPSRTLHPSELAAVSLAARVAGLEIAAQRRDQLDRLRAHATPLLARLGGPGMAVDPSGVIAAAVGVSAPQSIALPRSFEAGLVRLAGWGTAIAEPLPGGWLLRLDVHDPDAAVTVRLDLTAEPLLTVTTPTGDWQHAPTPRHAELLLALVQAGADGLTAGELAREVFADQSRTVTVRAEMSRMRKALAGVLLSQPYRLAAQCQVVWPADPARLLPGSSAPVVARLRRRVKAGP